MTPKPTEGTRRLLLTANSPGEMAGWVAPLVAAWTARGLGPVDLLLLPCTFATGQEERVARGLDGIDRIYRPKDYLRLLIRDGKDYQDGVLLHLGGDLMYSAFLSWRWKLMSWSYLWTRPWWNSAFKGFFTKNEWGVNWLLKRRAPREKIVLVGDLVLDAVRQHVGAEPSLERSAQISYLPGSRAIEVQVLAPFFLELHSRIQKLYPGLSGVLHLSPFLPQSQLQEILQAPPDPAVGGIQGSLEEGRLIGLDSELQLATQDGHRRLSESRLAVSIPGTKTAEAGYLRTPVLTIIPLNKPEHLPSIGLIGLLDLIPGGAVLKGRLMLRMKPRIGLLAHPNILAQKALLPEILEVVEAESLCASVDAVLREPGLLASVQEELTRLYSWSSSPAEAMVRTMAQSLK